MTTTAKLREKARYYESMLDWSNAALCWDDAVRLYPQQGEIAQRDIEKMRSRANDCRASAAADTPAAAR